MENLNRLDVFSNTVCTKDKAIVTRKEITEEMARRLYNIVYSTQADDNLTLHFTNTTL